MNEWDDLKSFIVTAKINTYAAGAEPTVPSRPGSKDLHFQKGKYRYIDSYLGESDFIGEEAVYFENQPVWGMNYFGEMLVGSGVPPGFSHCLKEALKTVSVTAPYRGPSSYREGNFEYHCMWRGDFRSFDGEEEISLEGKKIYRLQFHGGLIHYFNEG